MIIDQILEGLECEIVYTNIILENLSIQDICYDSRKATENTIFVAIDGETVDGHRFIRDAHENGCRVFVVSKDVPLLEDSIYIEVSDGREALSKISANFFENPSKEMKIIGITGTKGKTTTSNYVKAILEKSGKKTGIIGTNGVFYAGIKEETDNTTPESYEIHRIFKDMLNEGIEYVVMEVSSSGLMMDRVLDVDYDIGVFTNISEDHIGPKEHPNFEHYLRCKARLFKLCKLGIVNVDDKYSYEILRRGTCNFITYSIDEESEYEATGLVKDRSLNHLGIEFRIRNSDSKYFISSPGKFSVYNALAAIITCKSLGVSDEIIKEVLSDIHVPGRVELVKGVPKGSVILDYAHNKTSLINVLDTLKDYHPRRLICLIGSVGGRGLSRRHEIGEVISEKCDVCILTSDNPDFEDPTIIIEDIIKGFSKDVEYIVEPDRKEAILKGLDMLRDEDILLLAGKGHEEHQLIEGKKVKHSDKETVINYLSTL